MLVASRHPGDPMALHEPWKVVFDDTQNYRDVD